MTQSLSHEAEFQEGEAPAELIDAKVLGSTGASPSPSGTDSQFRPADRPTLAD